MSTGLIAVTGAGGFIGSALCSRLVSHAYRVNAHLGPPGVDVNHVPGVTREFCAEINDGGMLSELFAGADAAVHLAGPPSVGASFDDPIRYVRAHVEGTTATLDAARRCGIRRFVYVSSAEVYGRSESARVSESHPLAARSPYAAAKIAAEQMVWAYSHAFDLRATIIRPFSVFGPGMGRHSLIHTILRQLPANGPIRLADLRPVRDYCFIDDVAGAIELAIASPLPDTTVINVGSGVGTSVGELAQIATRIAGRDRPIEELIQNRRPGNADILRLVADRTKAYETLGWEPQVDVAAGLRAMIAGHDLAS